MKIRVVAPVPIEARHGVVVGAIFETIASPPGKPGVWIVGKAGERVRLWEYEVEVLPEVKP